MDTEAESWGLCYITGGWRSDVKGLDVEKIILVDALVWMVFSELWHCGHGKYAK